MDTPATTFLRDTRDQIRTMPLPQLQIVASLLSTNRCFPQAIQDWLTCEIAIRVDLTRVSPIAESVIRLAAFNKYKEFEFGKTEVSRQLSFLQSMCQEDHVIAASDFVLDMMRMVIGLLPQSAPAESTSHERPSIAAVRPEGGAAASLQDQWCEGRQ